MPKKLGNLKKLNLLKDSYNLIFLKFLLIIKIKHIKLQIESFKLYCPGQVVGWYTSIFFIEYNIYKFVHGVSQQLWYIDIRKNMLFCWWNVIHSASP